MLQVWCFAMVCFSKRLFSIILPINVSIKVSKLDDTNISSRSYYVKC